MLLRVLATLVMMVTVPVARPASEVNVRDTRLLHQPATNGSHVAFVYADDLWVARIEGTELRRLTTDDGIESRPAFSPDGNLIAFTAQYDGNRDVYVVAAEGGVPKRLTWHPGQDEVEGFSPDGRRVLFTSPRAVFTGRDPQLERAIATVLEELKKSTPASPKRPSYPIKGKTLRGTSTTTTGGSVK